MTKCSKCNVELNTVSDICPLCNSEIKNKIDTEYIMLLFTVILTYILSTLSGYTFFNSSCMIIIIVANVLLENKMKVIEEEKDCKKYNGSF